MVAQKKLQEQLTKNLLVPIILDLLNDHPMCGYEMMLIIRKTYGVNLGASTIYPILSNLDSLNLVSNDWEIETCHPKKIYKLTQQGQNVLRESLLSLSQICKKLEGDQKKEKNVQIGMIFR
ncbi:MAG: PadR family transcriptional regulator [Ignavibacteria bacterium]